MDIVATQSDINAQFCNFATLEIRNIRLADLITDILRRQVVWYGLEPSRRPADTATHLLEYPGHVPLVLRAELTRDLGLQLEPKLLRAQLVDQRNMFS